MDNPSSSSEMKKAFLLLEKGNLSQAKILFESLLKIGERQAEIGLQKTNQELLRKAWKQGKVEDFEKNAPAQAQIALARLKGKKALQEIATTQNPEAFLAAFSLEPSLKDSLLSLRKIPGHKEMAEGWICLLKQDFIKARLSFEAALSHQPNRAKLALAIIDVIQGKIVEGQQKLSSFLKTAAYRFPLLAEFMGKKKEETQATYPPHLVNCAFYLGNDKTLEKVLHSLAPHQKEEKGWILSRLGDFEYSQNKSSLKAIQNWNKALQTSSKLKLDIQRRLFLATENPDEKKDLFSTYFHALYAQNKEAIPSFLQDLLQQDDLSFCENMTIPFFAPAQKKWTIPNPPKELSLLALGILSKRYSSFLLANPPPNFTPLQINIPSLFLQDLPLLDPLFSDKPFYLNLKLEIYSLTGQIDEKRKVLAKLIEKDPSQIERLLPKYTQCALLCQDEKNRPSFVQELYHLASLFPSQYDLARLLHLQGQTQEANAYAQKLPATLQTILQLQINIDWNHKEETESLYEEALALYDQNQEANWRFWHAIANCKTIPTKQIQLSFKELLPTKEIRKQIFTQIFKYQEVDFCKEFIEFWATFTKDWTPYMLYFLQSLNDSDLDPPTPPEDVCPDQQDSMRILALIKPIDDLDDLDDLDDQPLK